MHYEEFEPDERLALYVKCFWILESDDPGPHEKQRIFPDGSIEWIFHQAGVFHKYTNDTDFVVQSHSFLHGQLRHFFDLQSIGKRRVFSVRFQPAGLQPFVRFPVDQLTDATLNTTDCWPHPETEQLVNEVLASETAECMRLVSDFLLRCYDPQRDDVPIRNAVGQLITEHGNSSMEQLLERTHLSRRAFERRFQSAVGLSPKLFARIIRFNHLLQLIERNDFGTFTALAHENGFYDQAHFIRDFKNITGLNPRKYFEGNLELVRFFNLSDV